VSEYVLNIGVAWRVLCKAGVRGGTELTVMTVIDRFHSKESLEKKEGTIKNGQSRETDNMLYFLLNQSLCLFNIICVHIFN
jgi:hypothetical protein